MPGKRGRLNNPAFIILRHNFFMLLGNTTTAIMETKQNKATYNRPEGDRVLDGTLVRTNLPDSIRQIKSENAWENSDRNAITLLHSAELRILLMALKQNADVNPHAPAGDAFIQVIEGRIWLETEDQSLSLDAGDALAIAPGINRRIHAEEEAVLLLTLSGQAGDNENGTDFNRQSTF